MYKKCNYKKQPVKIYKKREKINREKLCEKIKFREKPIDFR